MSWDQTYNDVYLLDLKTGKPKKVLEHWGNAATMSPGGKYVLHFDETSRPLAHLPRRRRRAREPDREDPDAGSSRRTTRPICRARTAPAAGRRTTSRVLLYDKFDIWEVKPDGTGARMVTGGEGRKQDVTFRYRSLDPEERAVPANKPLLLSAVNDRTRATGFYRARRASRPRRRPRRS